MRTTIPLIAFILFAGSSFSQHEYMLWTELEAEGKIIKKMDWSFEWNTRFGERGVETFFPQAGISYKVTKWFKPSVDYRFVVDKNDIGNYKPGNRININAQLGDNIGRFDPSLRIRYQYAFTRLRPGVEYNEDFDQAIRFKPKFEYDIDNSIFTPEISTEFFYNPTYGPEGRRFTKIRFAVGTSFEIDGPHSVSVKYQLDKRLRDPERDLRHVLSLSYGFEF